VNARVSLNVIAFDNAAVEMIPLLRDLLGIVDCILADEGSSDPLCKYHSCFNQTVNFFSNTLFLS